MGSGARAAHAIATATWAAVVPLFAGDRDLRLSRDGGRTYRRRGQVATTSRLPAQPAAVLIYDRDGRAPVMSLDFDVKLGLVDEDVAWLTAHLDATGCRWFTDTSPVGGRHVYVPLAEPVGFVAATQFVRLLKRLTPSLDPQPMLNMTDGCLRPPGARHRSGGHQRLDGPVAAAVSALSERTSTRAWRALQTRLEALASTHAPSDAATEPRPGRQDALGSHDGPVDGPVDALQLSPLPGWTAPDRAVDQIARTGVFDVARFPTASHARQHVMWAAVTSGWRFADVVRRYEDGTWRGLRALYMTQGRSEKAARRLLAREWRKAHSFEVARREKHTAKIRGAQSVRVCNTSATSKTRAGVPTPVVERTVRQEVSGWLAVVDLLYADDLNLRTLLYALAQQAVVGDAGGLVVDHGCRSLSVSTAMDHSTVSRLLNELAAQPSERAVIELVKPARRTQAHAWQLRVPKHLREWAAVQPWRRGRVNGLRPVFRDLGNPAMYVYEVLENAQEPKGSREIARVAHVGVTATAEVLRTLSAWGLATRTAAGWTVGPASPRKLAEQWGILEEIEKQIAQHRLDRRRWWQWLAQRGLIVWREPARRAAVAGRATADDHPRDMWVGNAHDGRAPPAPFRAPGAGYTTADEAATVFELLRDALQVTRVG